MVISVLRRVFRHNRYRFAVLGVAFMVLSAALLLPNIDVLFEVFRSQEINFVSKIYFLISLYGSLLTNYTVISGLYLVVVSLLFGVNIALLTFYIRRRQEVSGTGKIQFASITGFISSVLGIGCAACGSVILTSVFGLVGVGSFMSFLPFHGLEFGVIGIMFLLLSILYVIKRINDPFVCPAKL